MKTVFYWKIVYLDGLFGLDEFDFADAFDEKGVSEVSDSKHEVVFSITDGDDCIVGENKGVVFVLLKSLFWN